MIRKLMFLLGVLAWGAVSCVPGPSTGRLRTDSEQVELNGAEVVEVNILMGAGELEINGGGQMLLDGKYRYSDRELLPDVSYRVQDNGAGYLEIEQEENPGYRLYDRFYNYWDLRFNPEIPLDIYLTMGAGESNLDLEDLNLRSLNMQMGAGEAYLDLGSPPGQDLDVNIQGGVGELTVVLPRGVWIEADVKGGLGEIHTSGLVREGDLYVNDDIGSGPVIRLFIEAGIGELNLLVQ